MKYALAAFLALALCFVCLVFARAQEPRYAALAAAGNKQEPVQAEGTGTTKHIQFPANLFDHPTAILCAVPGKQPRRIEIPAGRKPTDFCPASAITERYYNIKPGIAYFGPAYDNIPPPVGWLPKNKTTGQPP